ncbi:MAG: FAD-linked oxidase C-terminal domain-containing protein [Lysobacterales bacterium]
MAEAIVPGSTTVSAATLTRLVSALREALPRDALLLEPAERVAYGYDNSRLQAMPDLVTLPTDAAQVQRIVATCAELRVPLTARGRGTNTTGATVPVAGGVVLSFERMRRIVAIDADNRVAIVEPGVLNVDLQVAAGAHGLFWPPDPTSSAYCTIGGNLACNAGGPRAVKYGATRDNTLGLKAVTGQGHSITCGGSTTKGSTGYDLTRLLVGSEGTLAVITEATLRLVPLPDGVITLRALFDSVETCARAVARIMAQPQTPCALEFVDGAALELLRARGIEMAEAGAMLMIEVDGTRAALRASVESVAAATRGAGMIELLEAGDADAVAELWSARRALSPALRTLSPNKVNEDVVVPVAQLPALIAGVEKIARAGGVQIVTFGHAGNGNLHINLLPRANDAAQEEAATAALDLLFDLVLSLGGTLSGEHGIGMVKRGFMTRAISPATLELMRAIKRQFDPCGILNPGKLLPD